MQGNFPEMHKDLNPLAKPRFQTKATETQHRFKDEEAEALATEPGRQPEQVGILTPRRAFKAPSEGF